VLGAERGGASPWRRPWGHHRQRRDSSIKKNVRIGRNVTDSFNKGKRIEEKAWTAQELGFSTNRNGIRSLVVREKKRHDREKLAQVNLGGFSERFLAWDPHTPWGKGGTPFGRFSAFAKAKNHWG